MNIHHKRPSKETLTGRIWELADNLSRQSGRMAERKAVIAAYVAEGGNAATASTQYALWKDSFDASRLPLPPSPPADAAAQRLQIGRDGRILLPADVRAALRLDETGVVTVDVKDGVLTLVSPRTALLQLQALIKRSDNSTRSVVDELLAERRAEASAE